MSFVSATSDTMNGKYSLNITQIATQGTALGSSAASLTINSGSNDILDFSVNGVSSSITIAAGTYTASSLASEIQSKINGLSKITSAGIKVAVTESSGILKITSDQYGSSSTVSITGGNTKASLFGTPIETAGLNVAGSLNGITATGTGQTLTGLSDSSGLVLKITGGSVGARGEINFAHGFAAKLDNIVDKMLDNRLIESRIDGINSSIKDINSQRETLNRRLVGIEERIRAQFTALDSMVASMTQTSNFLQQQLSKLPTIK